jgi:hypothetical protein
LIQAFGKFYASAGYSVLLKEWGIGEENALSIRYCTKKQRPITSFSMSRPAEAAELDLDRRYKMEQFQLSLANLYRKLQHAKRESKDLYEGHSGVYFQFWKDSPQYADLPSHHRDVFDQLFVVAAHVLYNILDDPERLKRAQSIAHKIPVSFLVTSLYFINPYLETNQALPLLTKYFGYSFGNHLKECIPFVNVLLGPYAGMADPETKWKR